MAEKEITELQQQALQKPALKRLRENGFDVEALIDHVSCGLQFKFKDPNGNKFNLWQDIVK